VFDEHMTGPNQIPNKREDFQTSAAELIAVPEGTRTEAGLRQNISVGIQYVAAWLGGLGSVPLYHLMEDAATAEISRTQVWQWLRYGATLDDGRAVDRPLFDQILAEELASIESAVGDDAYAAGHYEQAKDLFVELVTAEELAEFLTLPAYDLIKEAGIKKVG
jgi:malate synthase